MINDIISGISNALYEEFGTNYKIYKETVKQGLKEPCFIIVCISSSSKRKLGNRYMEESTFCIHYLTNNKNPYADCFEVFERMADCLEYITVTGDLVHGTNIKSEEMTGNGEMHVLVDYKIATRKVEEKEKMGTYTLKSEVKK